MASHKPERRTGTALRPRCTHLRAGSDKTRTAIKEGSRDVQIAIPNDVTAQGLPRLRVASTEPPPRDTRRIHQYTAISVRRDEGGTHSKLACAASAVLQSRF